MIISIRYYPTMGSDGSARSDSATSPVDARPGQSLSARGAFLLSQLGYHVATRCREVLAPLDLHPAHYGILMHLTTMEGISQQRLADVMGVHRNAMVGLVDELEQRGLLRRERDPDDRRAHRLLLTDHAHAILVDANTAVDSLEEEVFAGLGAEEREGVVMVLHRLAAQANLPKGIHPGLRRQSRPSRT
jgi:DNA-binding MarR family transcriptional regulator